MENYFFSYYSRFNKKYQAIRLPMSIQGIVRSTECIEITYICRYNLIMEE